MKITKAVLGRVLVEFLLIVAGVLTALAVDASWQRHVDRSREHEYLEQLRSDMLENRTRLRASIALEEDQARRVRSVLDALRSADPILSDSAASWIAGEPPFPWFSDPRLLDGTLVALVETGDINLIRDATVRSSAIRYLGQLRSDLTEFGRSVQLFQDLAMQFWRTMEVGRMGDVGPQEDVARTLLAAQSDPELTVLFRLFLENIGTRSWYLTQMLDVTESLLLILAPESTATS